MDWGMHLEEDNEEDIRQQWLQEEENRTMGPARIKQKQPEIKVFFRKLKECIPSEQLPAGVDGECVQADHHHHLGEAGQVQGNPEQDYVKMSEPALVEQLPVAQEMECVRDDHQHSLQDDGGVYHHSHQGEVDVVGVRDDQQHNLQDGGEVHHHSHQGEVDIDGVRDDHKHNLQDDRGVHHSHQGEVDVDGDDNHNAWEAGHLQHHLSSTNNQTNLFLFKDDEPGVEHAGGPHEEPMTMGCGVLPG